MREDSGKGTRGMSLFPELTGLMAKYSIQPNRMLGQHFITDQALIERIVREARLEKTDTVLEIGAGTGFLTRELQKHCRVIAVEKDEALAELLHDELAQENLCLINRDFLEEKPPEFNKIVSLPPYSISSKIMQRLFTLDFNFALVVFQKEFVEKLLAHPGFGEYSAISVLAQYYFAPTVITRVTADSFFPKPKTASLLLKLESKKRFGKANDEQAFQVFIKNVFRFGNKNLRKALLLSSQFLRLKNEKAFAEKVEGLQLKDKKVNLLEVKEFVELFNSLF